MGLLKDLDIRDSAFQPYLNTGTLYDLQTGVFVPGSHGGMILNGGISTTNAYMGRQQMFKSTLLMSHMVRAMSYYPSSESYTLDTENSLKKERIVGFSPFEHNHIEIDERMAITIMAEMSAEDFFETIKKIAQTKLGNPKFYQVESPILDPRTGKRLLMFIPTFVCIDSWSEMKSSFMQTTLDTKTMGSSDTNMIYMKDGNIKKMMMSQIPSLAVRAGIYFFFSAHIGDVHKLDPYAPSIKSLQHMRGSDKPKEVGSNFNFLVSNVVDMRKVELMLDGDKHCLYPTDGGSDVELNEQTEILVRCKNNASGSQLSSVISQTHGVMGDLSNYHYIRGNDYFGLLGNKIHHKPAMTDVSLSRTTVREKLKDPKVSRAIELLAQLCYVQRNWVTTGIDIDFTMKPELLADKLLASDKPGVKDVLESRGYWTYDQTNLQPYLSLYDVLAVTQGVYRAKGISLSGLTPVKQAA